MRITRRFAPPLVIVAACSSHAKAPQPPPDQDGPRGPYTEFRDGTCRILPDCTPPPGEHFNPCNPPPPERPIDCPADMLPTQPPDTTIETQPDGTCWITCTADTCDAPGALRVACPTGDPPTYEHNLVIPTQRVYTEKDYTVTRDDNLVCNGDQHGTAYPNVPCPAEIAPHVADGVVPVYSTAHYLCYYGKYAVACPKPSWHVWH